MFDYEVPCVIENCCGKFTCYFSFIFHIIIGSNFGETMHLHLDHEGKFLKTHVRRVL